MPTQEQLDALNYAVNVGAISGMDFLALVAKLSPMSPQRRLELQVADLTKKLPDMTPEQAATAWNKLLGIAIEITNGMPPAESKPSGLQQRINAAKPPVGAK